MYQKTINDRLAMLYNGLTINGQYCFEIGDGTIITIDGLPQWGCIVVGYANGKEEAYNNMFEDGDLFPIKEMTQDEMVAAILNEIQS
ncbi:hypothetical protein IJI17_02805 [Candidatus Saccharibacteria bacterium]|nr:hypothetical protein [Achromobacter sp.]MBQ3839381.1 hypothetical protein [Fibrobacter sp.]MBQ6321120.1 hypothetical protein [Candidatus Saccharibacteria bacterium]